MSAWSCQIQSAGSAIPNSGLLPAIRSTPIRRTRSPFKWNAPSLASNLRMPKIVEKQWDSIPPAIENSRR